MGATLLSSPKNFFYFAPHFSVNNNRQLLLFRGEHVAPVRNRNRNRNLLFNNSTNVSLNMDSVGVCGCKNNSMFLTPPFLSRSKKKFSVKSSDQLPSHYANSEATTSLQALDYQGLTLKADDQTGPPSSSHNVDNSGTLKSKPKMFQNRFLDLIRLSSVFNNAAESFFKSEIRRRLFVTAVLLVISRVGYYIPLPGFDRRLIPQDYLGFISGSVGKVKHVMVTAFLLVCGAMTVTWICDTITESGFGQGSSLVICVGILTGYIDTLHKMLTQLSGSAVSWWPYVFAVLGLFILVTMWAVIVTEGCRKVKLQYYGFKLASSTRDDSPITEVEPYIPFNINPSGMQPVLTTAYVLSFPSILAGVLESRFWEHIKQILNPDNSIGAAPWANMPKEISDYLNKMGARVPHIKPGKATIEYLTKIQASTRFWGGLMLSVLATGSTILDHYLRRVNEGFAIGFTSVLIIVGSIIELRRSYQAYNVMPSLSKALRRYGV
ncbi:hypothetical protein ACFE04_031531 [Oxalis oulophora]